LERQELAGTDYAAALCLSWAAVALQRPPADSGCDGSLQYDFALRAAPPTGPGSRVVVLITDGEPSPDGATHGFGPNDTPARCAEKLSYPHDYMCQLATTWKKLTSIKPVDLRVIGLDRNGVWFPTAAAYWQGMTGCGTQNACDKWVVRNQDPTGLTADLLRAAVDIFYNLCPAAGGKNECKLPALVAYVDFLIEGIRAGDTIQIVDSGGNRVVPGSNVTVTSSASAQRWRITKPPKGIWRVESTRPDAVLRVSQYVSLQKFGMEASPNPAPAGGNVDLNLDIEGEPLVDVKSLLNETLSLTLRRNGTAQPAQGVNLIQGTSPTKFRVDRALTNAPAGQWHATLTVDFNGTPTVVAEADFEVRQEATPTPTRTPVPPTATATPVPEVCGVSLKPQGRDVKTESLGFKLGYPLKFHRASEVSASIAGKACPAAAAGGIHGRLRLVGPDPCPTTQCQAESTGRDSLSLSLRFAEDADELPVPLQRIVEVEGPNGWREVGSDEVNLHRPGIFQLERDSYFGYWAPFLGLALILLGISIAATFDKRRGVPLWKLGNFNSRRTRNEPIVRWRLGVWRWVRSEDRRGLLSRKYLAAGDLVVRWWPAKPTRSQIKTLKDLLQHWLQELPRVARGSKSDADNLNLSEMKRVPGR
jgi:hypothetical protein